MFGDTTNQVDEARNEVVTIPYNKKFGLGCTLDFRNLNQKAEIEKHDCKNTTEARFSVVENLCQVCDILGIAPEYALKVQARIVDDPVVEECLKDVYRKDCITVVFRVTYLRETIYTERSFEAKPTHATHKHYVSAIDAGNELVSILKLSTSDLETENLNYFSEKLTNIMTSSHGMLDESTFSEFEKFAKKLEIKLSKSYCGDMRSSVYYGCFSKDEICPASVTGMVKALKDFKKRHEIREYVGGNRILQENMKLKEGCADKLPAVNSDPIRSPGVVNQSFNEHCEEPYVPEVAGSPNSGKLCSTDSMFYTKISIKPCVVYGGLNQRQSQTRDPNVFNRLSLSYSQFQTGEEILKTLKSTSSALLQAHLSAGTRNIPNEISCHHIKMVDFIKNLDLMSTQLGSILEHVSGVDPVQMAEEFSEKVTSTLPKGQDLSILVVGSTGHGKSLTMHNILKLGHAQDSRNTQFLNVEQGPTKILPYAKIDGRKIFVTNMPLENDEPKNFESNLGTKKAVSDPGHVFDAVLIVMRFGMKMTDMELRFLSGLKEKFGKDVIKKYCVFVFTYGDQFERQCEGKKTFEEWCHEQNNIWIKHYFKQCEYRCVLINNREKDPKKMKRQIVQLIVTVDKVNSDTRNGTVHGGTDGSHRSSFTDKPRAFLKWAKEIFRR